jgi:hypothetical protein
MASGNTGENKTPGIKMMINLINKCKARSETWLYITAVIVSYSIFCFRCNVETGLRPVSTLYINNQTGNDNNSGTIKKPVKTIAEINKRIQNAVPCRDGSETRLYMFAGSQEFDGTLILNNIHGIDSMPVIIGSYGEDRAIINGGNKEAISIQNCKYIRIMNLDLKGNGRKEGNTTNGLQLSNSTDCVVENIYAEGFRKSGIDLYNCRSVKVLEVTAFGNGFCGINLMGSHQDSSENILIRDCKAENNAGDPTILDNHSGNGILVGVSDSVIIDHCTATNNGWDMPRQGNGPVGIWTWMSDHVTIQYCISYRNRTSKGGKDGGGFDLDGGVTNSLIQYCLSYENEGAGYGLFQYPGASDWSNNIIRYCVSIDDARTTEGAGSFFIWNGSNESRQLSNCYIHNNVACSSSAPVISFESASDHVNFVFSNNIFLGSGQMISGENTGSRFLGNVWWNTGDDIRFMEYNSMISWAKATGQETENGRFIGIETDPLFIGPFTASITDPYKLRELSGYCLSSASPLKNCGIEIKPLFGFDPPSIDFFGSPVPQGSAPEPGIFELR